MVHANYFLPDFLEIQRQGFFSLLEKGIAEEIQKRNPITNFEKQVEIFFYPEYYRFTKPLYSLEQAIFFKKSYVAKLYVPVQFTNRKKKQISLKWVLLAHFPLMTNRGHFVLNGSPRVIIHQLVRSPGIYFREKKHEVFLSKWSEKPITTFHRFYADIICSKGTWLRIESEKDFSLWAKMKKGPKIPLLWFLLGMGLSQKYILNSVAKPTHLFESFNREIEKLEKSNSSKEPKYPYVASPQQAWEQIQKLLKLKKTAKKYSFLSSEKKTASLPEEFAKKRIQQAPFRKSQIKPSHLLKKKIESFDLGRKWFFNKFMNPQMYDLGQQGRVAINKKLGLTIPEEHTTLTALDLLLTTDYLMKMADGVFEIDDIDHLKNKRVRSSGECIQEIFGIGFHRLERSIRFQLNSSANVIRLADPKIHSRSSVAEQPGSSIPKNRLLNHHPPIRPQSGPLHPTAEQMPTAFVPSGHEKRSALRSDGQGDAHPIRFSALQMEEQREQVQLQSKTLRGEASPFRAEKVEKQTALHRTIPFGVERTTAHLQSRKGDGHLLCSADAQKAQRGWASGQMGGQQYSFFHLQSLFNTRSINGAFREFFGTHPLSQFMDQINPLAEITHKRRLTSLGPGGVSRDTATLAIRGIHPSHYGRICPIETPEGKNTGLVNSLTTYAKLSSSGLLKSPFYKVLKGQVQHNAGVFFLDPGQEEHYKIATPDLNSTDLGFLPKSSIPVRLGKRFVRQKPHRLALIGLSPLQMISVATAFIPFLEHDDANRALMGSNMQRQAVPLLKPERPFLGTGLEARVLHDSGHAVFAKKSGYVLFSTGSKISIYVF